MRAHLKWAAGLAVILALSLAGIGIAAPAKTVVRAGNLILTISGGVTPQSLPKKELAPVGLHETSNLRTVDGTPPPALREVVFDADKNGAVEVRGLPVCRAGQLQARDSVDAKKACPGAILGSGNASVNVAFPDQTPFETSGPLVLFNGGSKGGVTTLFLHTYVSVPAPTAIVATIRITKEHRGPFGLHIVATVPVIAGGSGSVTRTHLTIGRRYRYRGRKRSFISAKCSDGHFIARGEFLFRDETQLVGSIIQPCGVSK